MLSLILKPLFKNTEDKIELPFDTEISLSMIESGCLFISLNHMAALVIIGSLDDINLLKNINKVTFDLELIERPEFPSLGMHMEINTASSHKFKFDYFFNTESEAGLELLKNLNIRIDVWIDDKPQSIIPYKAIKPLNKGFQRW